jgi:hypothetical protein
MADIAGWVAPGATMIAGMMTAANFGSRVTGYGFVVFLVGAIAWSIVALMTGQPNLLWSNAFLALVDIIGIHRWLGHRARLDDGAKEASTASSNATTAALFPVSQFDTAAVRDRSGRVIARSVGAMAECGSGRLSYIVAREGGSADMTGRYIAIPWSTLRATDGDLVYEADTAGLDKLRQIDSGHWPAASPDAHPTPTRPIENNDPGRFGSSAPRRS